MRFILTVSIVLTSLLSTLTVIFNISFSVGVGPHNKNFFFRNYLYTFLIFTNFDVSGISTITDYLAKLLFTI